MDLRRVSHSDNFHNILCTPPPPRADIFFLPFLSPSAPVCFYSCKMLVALLKYCSALSALFFLLPTPLPLVFFPFVTPTHHHHNSAPPSTPAQPPHLSCCCCRGQRWWGGRVRGGAGRRINQGPVTWVRHVTVAQERKSIHERMRSTGVDYRLGPWLLEGWREMEEV